MDGSIVLDLEGNESGVNGNGKIVGVGGGFRVEEDEDFDDEFYDVERIEVVFDVGDQSISDVLELVFWVEEFKVFVSGGVFVVLRGEVCFVSWWSLLYCVVLVMSLFEYQFQFVVRMYFLVLQMFGFFIG